MHTYMHSSFGDTMYVCMHVCLCIHASVDGLIYVNSSYIRMWQHYKHLFVPACWYRINTHYKHLFVPACTYLGHYLINSQKSVSYDIQGRHASSSSYGTLAQSIHTCIDPLETYMHRSFDTSRGMHVCACERIDTYTHPLRQRSRALSEIASKKKKVSALP
jgi:hypothetical protein